MIKDYSCDKCGSDNAIWKNNTGIVCGDCDNIIKYVQLVDSLPCPECESMLTSYDLNTDGYYCWNCGYGWSVETYKIRTDLDKKLENDIVVYRIEALVDIPSQGVKKGNIGGFVQSSSNLMGWAWVFDDACVYDGASVRNYATVRGSARIYESATIRENAIVRGSAKIHGNANIYGKANVYDNAEVFGFAQVKGECKVYGEAKVYDNAEILYQAEVFENATIKNRARVENGKVYGHASVYGSANIIGTSVKIYGNAHVYGRATIGGAASVYDNARVASVSLITGHAEIFGDAHINMFWMKKDLHPDWGSVQGYAKVYGNARIEASPIITGNVEIFGNALIDGGTCIVDSVKIYENAKVHGLAAIKGNAQIYGNAEVFWGNAKYSPLSRLSTEYRTSVGGDAKIYDNARVRFLDRGFNILGCVYGNAYLVDSLVPKSVHVCDNAIMYNGETMNHIKGNAILANYRRNSYESYSVFEGNAYVTSTKVWERPLSGRPPGKYLYKSYPTIWYSPPNEYIYDNKYSVTIYGDCMSIHHWTHPIQNWLLFTPSNILAIGGKSLLDWWKPKRLAYAKNYREKFKMHYNINWEGIKQIGIDYWDDSEEDYA